VNLNGIYYACKHFLPQMMERRAGAVVNTSSISGLLGDYWFAAYNASKGAVANLTRSMALDYCTYNIRVNAVAPQAGGTKLPSATETTCFGREERKNTEGGFPGSCG
jgi:meso-butanediol dehydrogenase/(S,S)-butanediol dehydrogenase/diacetyl reductase